MDMNGYQHGARETAQYPQDTQVRGLEYTVMGLCGEAGEIANKFKKVLRGDHGEALTTLTPELQKDFTAELGDVLWYVAEIATQLEIDLSDVAAANLAKLRFRKEKNTIKGAGDNR